MLKRTISGNTILEVLIGLTIGIFIIGGSVGMMYGVMKSSVDTLRITRLEHELRTTLNLIANDIRRAGYWANANADIDSNANTNPFQTGGNELQVSADCVLMSYDLNQDGAIAAMNTSPSDERFGYRLSGTVVQSRPAAFTSMDCASAANAWENLTNNNVLNVTALNFVLNNQVVDIDGAGPGTATVAIRRVDISITGALADDAAVTRTLTDSVRVRNDVYTP